MFLIISSSILQAVVVSFCVQIQLCGLYVHILRLLCFIFSLWKYVLFYQIVSPLVGQELLLFFVFHLFIPSMFLIPFRFIVDVLADPPRPADMKSKKEELQICRIYSDAIQRFIKLQRPPYGISYNFLVAVPHATLIKLIFE